MDRFLARELSEKFSRSKLQSIIESGEVYVNGRSVDDVSYHLKPRDEIVISCDVAPKNFEVSADDSVKFTILYEDDDIVVVNKPAGVVVHPGAGNYDHTLVNGLVHHCELSAGSDESRPGIVHRIDKDTSGILVIAKNDLSHAALAEQFQVHSIKRKYICFCYGVPRIFNGKIETFIARDPNNRLKMTVSKDRGKKAITHYKTLRQFGRFATKMECELFTGRTHQIRVHMSHMGHSLIGDAVYKRKNYAIPKNISDYVNKFPRQALHAYLLEFIHPTTNEMMHFEEDLPQDLIELEKEMAKVSAVF